MQLIVILTVTLTEDLCNETINELYHEIDLILRSLADIIKEKKTEIETTYTDAGSLQRRELDPDIVELCQGIGQGLKKYRKVT